MSTRIYTLPIEQTKWKVPSGNTTVFSWDYDEGNDRLLALYEKGKAKQWNSSERIDWSIAVDLDSPDLVPDEYVPIYGSDLWDRLGTKERQEVKQHVTSWQFSQFLHGEQGALICASKIVQTVPDLDSKFYAATQVMDEARHVEVFSRYLQEKVGFAYPINDSLKIMLNDTISDSRWDLTYLGMQVLLEGLALAGFGVTRDQTREPLARALNAYVMQDEARHVAFGRLALKDFYKELSSAELADREEFCVEACFLLRDRFLGEEIWETLDLAPTEAVAHINNSEAFKLFRSLLFTRIVPTLRDIGLMGPKVIKAFTEMDVLGFQDIDIEAVMDYDEQAAEEIDAQRLAQVQEAISLGAGDTE
ncbi:ferritin-like domain-containing protein [Streptomyces sp. So13.3]|uniref:ferritin-like domain-containing protein n=1 Tax=unclassified Streptomyces TaxID=2593676 RepID=UPI001106F19A|nr:MULTISPECIES: ferritin-like domain-containing protein [unclassified Streptomyces]MCZ4101617.1 ferritin-like domain-containing protein [Streptomyces sp. H39-C1]QNA76368.1 ferritin-like domain-containing protein [Streptomyces sp. So13.3]